MLKHLGALALSLMLPVGAWAQACGTADLIAELNGDERARLDALVAEHPYPEGILWRATKPGSEVTVVGTMHIPDDRFAPIVAEVAPVIRAADLLILEVTAEDQRSIEAMAVERPDFFFLNDGPSLIDLLSEEDWAEASARAAELGIPSFMTAKFKPWYLGMTLAMSPCAMASLMAGEVGLDARLESIAEASGIPVAALDDAEALIQLLGGDPLEDQLDGLRLALSITFDPNAVTSTMATAYFEGRVRELWEYSRILLDQLGVEGGQEMFEEMDEMLLVGRNADWEPKIAHMTDGQNVVIAVGAAHLSGESGVLRALERAGYVLERF